MEVMDTGRSDTLLQGTIIDDYLYLLTFNIGDRYI